MSVSLATISLKISRLVRLMSSDVDGEALAAVRALNRTLISAGHDWHWLADRIEAGLDAPDVTENDGDRPERWAPARRTDIATALEFGTSLGVFTEWEANFVASIAPKIRGWSSLSEKQIGIVERLLGKVRRAAA